MFFLESIDVLNIDPLECLTLKLQIDSGTYLALLGKLQKVFTHIYFVNCHETHYYD